MKLNSIPRTEGIVAETGDPIGQSPDDEKMGDIEIVGKTETVETGPD